MKGFRLKERKLLFAFTVLISLTVVIGLVGIFQIQNLHQKLENLAKSNLRFESAVLEMRINNAIYALGVRNYAFWKVSRYLSALSSGIGLEKISSVADLFKKSLRVYEQTAYLPSQKEWAGEIGRSFAELENLGSEIIKLADEPAIEKNSAIINSRLMAFENRVYKIDEFLNYAVGKSNLKEVERQIASARQDKGQAILLLRFALASAVVIGILIALSIYRRRIKERLYRQDMFNKMINLEEDERRRLSTSVHDELGQDLSALKIYLGVIEQGLGNIQQELRDKIDECKKIITGLIDKSHNIAFLLRPPDLDEVGLAESLEALLLEYKHLTGVDYSYEKPGVFFELSSEYSLLFYRICQELLTNMAKHSRAKRVELILKNDGANVRLSYFDDGRGFDYSQVLKHPFRRRDDKIQLGLLGLKERVEFLDGKMNIESGFGKGTKVIVDLPVIEKKT